LAVINLLNTIGPGPLAGKQVPAGIMPDVLGNGTLSPDDALQIIDYLNNLTPPPQPQDVAPAVSAAGPPVVTPAVASPLPATTNPSLPLAASEAATIILPAAVAAQTVPAESVAPLNTAATLQSSATQPAITSPLLAARTQFFASNGPPAAPSKSVLSGSQQMDPAAVAMAMSQHKGPWDTL
jgi:hypothetical protein